MIKLRSLLEIKVISKITPEMVEKLWDDGIGDKEGAEASKNRFYLRRKYFSTTQFDTPIFNLKNLKQLSQSQLNSFYQDLLNLKNS